MSQIRKQHGDNVARWYVVHTYSGYEQAVARNLRQRIDTIPGMKELIFEVLVPSEERVEIKNGKRIEKSDTVFPGYVLVNMIVTDESWYTVRNTPRVTGFVGAGTTPVPLTEAEFLQLSNRITEEKKHTADMVPGEYVVILDGPFKDLEGQVVKVDPRASRITVNVDMFGRETPVELDFLQVKKK
ncbi:transcription termination/antitermination factor NusG [Candidatus Kaiserbacteria bacterium RIFCSPHIGHO2_02_FULL_50_50]|uniref:Transcription termination/antitermination protein NusG n=1 Tax=Candidatus Kaiserbacteria bacterium RIFCSPHIGHO2_02_FULL_50_50 TaxID=1798492 RepID=A0A1F6DD35_9BACT|nr:MAG: transcription termination/antitermination factor NusG [Candidatus Kaiserbacteria bacterium RIFCSPHIGHO2_02_FULL_50_50]OGG88533.1 MAG: transcription termination/antitermination factor NusG [Candidatus Kaiserbacteria bacterium RIFCSPLOWO2_12_FULL_50_10]